MKRTTNLLFCLISGAIFSQTTILFEDFEDAELTYTTSIPDDLSDIAAFDYFGRIDDTSGLPTSVAYSNPQGLGFYGVQDIDGANSGNVDVLELNWEGIDISSFTNLNLSWYVAEDDANDGNEDWDPSDFVRLEVQVDGGGFSSVFAIESSGGTNTSPRVDTDFDGIGDGTEITDVFSQFSAVVTNGALLDIRLTIDGLGAGDEDLAFDNLLLTGTAADNEAPMLVCLEPFTIEINEGGCEANFDLPMLEVTDNISSAENIMVSVTRDDGLELTDLYPIDETILMIIATDEAGNTSEECMVTVTVSDGIAPELTCGPDISIVGSDSEVFNIEEPVVIDNCTVEPMVSFIRSDSATLTLDDPFGQGVTTITWTAIDDANNETSCTQTVTIEMGQSMANDITNFEIPNQLPGTTIDIVEKTVSLRMPMGTDLNGLVPNVSISADASVSPETGVPQDFSVPVVYTVIAEDGTIQEWTVIVEVEEDNEPPIIECPLDIVVNNDEGECSAIIEFEPVATDNSGSVSVNADFMTGNSFPIGTTLVTVTATDDAENISTCSFNVTVVDNVAPILICKDATVELGEGGNVNISITDVFDTLSDNCEVEVLSADKTSFTVEDLGENEVTVTAIDVNGNISSCTAIVTVLPFDNNTLSVTSFTLINADNDEELFDLFEGDVFEISDLPTLHLDIRANTTEDVESVRISLEGALSTARTESLMPFALFRDLPLGNYIGEDFVVGQYTVSATPYSEDRLGGEMGSPFSLNFELIDSTPTLSVNSFTLINADTDEELFDLTEGQQIDINTLPIRNLDIRANTTEDVGSVRIAISGALINERTESLPPYALFQDLPIGDYMGEEFTVGEYTVSAIPYSDNSLRGDKGASLTLNFELVDGHPACESLTAEVQVVNPDNCNGIGSRITIIPSGGTSPYEVSWQNFSSEDVSIDDLTAGIYTIDVSDSNGCRIRVEAEIENPELPEVTLEPFTEVLASDGAFELTGGMPAGGVYSGEGVADGMFDPSIGAGTYQIIYTFEDSVTECTNSAIQEITVRVETSNAIIAYWLVNADNEMDLFEITDGMQIDISSLPTENLDIRAETGSDTESVGFELLGTQSIMRGESIPPYALFQDLPIGDYIGHEFDLGEYTLSGTPYLLNSLKGESGETVTIDFEFVDLTPTMAVTSFTLISAESDGELFELTDGIQISINDIPSLFLDIRANTTSDVGSVRLELSGQQSTARTESRVPYALFRDLPIGDYIGNNFDFGTYTVTAIPYSADNLAGEMGLPLSITFEIVDNLELNNLKISPNQATTLARASFNRPTEIKQILIFDMSGRMIESYNPEYVKSGDGYILDVRLYQQGSYIVKMIDKLGTPYQKQMIVKRQ